MQEIGPSQSQGQRVSDAGHDARRWSPGRPFHGARPLSERAPPLYFGHGGSLPPPREGLRVECKVFAASGGNFIISSSSPARYSFRASDNHRLRSVRCKLMMVIAMRVISVPVSVLLDEACPPEKPRERVEGFKHHSFGDVAAIHGGFPPVLGCEYKKNEDCVRFRSNILNPKASTLEGRNSEITRRRAMFFLVRFRGNRFERSASQLYNSGISRNFLLQRGRATASEGEWRGAA